MTVAELMKRLGQLDPELCVYYVDDIHVTPVEAAGIEVVAFDRPIVMLRSESPGSGGAS